MTESVSGITPGTWSGPTGDCTPSHQSKNQAHAANLVTEMQVKFASTVPVSPATKSRAPLESCPVLFVLRVSFRYEFSSLF